MPRKPSNVCGYCGLDVFVEEQWSPLPRTEPGPYREPVEYRGLRFHNDVEADLFKRGERLNPARKEELKRQVRQQRMQDIEHRARVVAMQQREKQLLRELTELDQWSNEAEPKAAAEPVPPSARDHLPPPEANHEEAEE